jgi:hypothetical protein
MHWHRERLFEYALRLEVLSEVERLELAASYMTQRRAVCYETHVLQLSAEGLLLTFLNKLQSFKSCN